MRRQDKLESLLDKIEKTKKDLEVIRKQNIERGKISQKDAESQPVYYLSKIFANNVIFPQIPLDAPAVLVNLAIRDYRYKRAILLGKSPKQIRIRKLHDLHKEFTGYKLFRSGRKSEPKEDRSNRISGMQLLAQKIYSNESDKNADKLASRATKAFIQGKYRYKHPTK